jgi:hypothetical protein
MINYKTVHNLMFIPLAQQPNAGQGHLFLEVSRSYTMTRHSRLGSSGQGISPSEGPLPDYTQHSQETNIYTPGGIRTSSLSKRAA